jgi:hypothetical protein
LAVKAISAVALEAKTRAPLFGLNSSIHIHADEMGRFDE